MLAAGALAASTLLAAIPAAAAPPNARAAAAPSARAFGDFVGKGESGDRDGAIELAARDAWEQAKAVGHTSADCRKVDQKAGPISTTRWYAEVKINCVFDPHRPQYFTGTAKGRPGVAMEQARARARASAQNAGYAAAECATDDESEEDLGRDTVIATHTDVCRH
ncbi:hypothetical protein GCM10010123_37760 [Pilimelia anulata]|uniref:DUF4189 domain-containing protein n=2 Tax=Pilimelia anulata TaxID=53371 RepID=A0A8J3BC52_9ACTN|nr:hypothetical protein GCM10010123_37760 [Pilimelia anulata]